MCGVKVDYHVHTFHSYDCRSSLSDVIARAEAVGLDAICITDHDTIEAKKSLMLLPPSKLKVLIGCEFTTDDGSHVIGINVNEPISERKIFPLIAAIHAQEGLVLLPHLFRSGSGVLRDDACRSPEFVNALLKASDFVEVYNGRDSYNNNARSYQLVQERNLPCVAGSDAHLLQEIGSVCVAYDSPSIVQHGHESRQFFFSPQRAPKNNALSSNVREYLSTTYRLMPLAIRKNIGVIRSNFRARRLKPACSQFSINSPNIVRCYGS